jgi:septal ring factor EnvC (AmiA/AmiB activator)
MCPTSLQDKVEELTKKNEQLQRRLNETSSENRSLTDNLSRVQDEVSSMKQRTADFNNNKNILEVTEQRDVPSKTSSNQL